MSNIVTASFANGAVTTTTLTALWQYDYGQILRIEGVELPVAYEVHFCNAGDADTVTSIGDSDGVVIPDQFLQNGKTIYAYIYLHAGADDGETEYKISIPVYDRAEPTDIEPTPAQESTIGQLIDALNEGVGDAEAAVEAAWDAAAHYPYINDDGNWMVWDADNGEFVDSGVSAEGSEPAFISYGSGLYDDIAAAVGDGKACNCVYVDDDSLTWYIPLVKRENDRFIFSCSFRTSIYTAYCNTASSWSISHEDYPVRGVQMPKNLGTKAVGSSYNFSREDHVHQMPSASDVGAIANPSGGLVGQVLKKTADGVEWANESGGGGGAVDSVNGQTGVVVLDASDVGALADSTTYVSSVNGSSGSVTVTVPTKTSDLQNDSGFITSAPVTSVNNKTGAVSLTASDVGAGTYSKPSGGIPKTDLASAVQTSLGKADTALQSAPVTSVNGQTGAVTVSVPSASSATPQALGTAAAGSSTDYSRADHVHDFNSDFVTALLQLAEKVAYIDGNGQTYYAALEAALTHRTLSSISAVYTQSGTVYDTDSLESLKTDLVVTAHYSDSSTATVAAADYTLSGTLTVGTSTITVSYEGKTTTFTVTVTAGRVPSGYEEVEYIYNPNGTSTGPIVDTGVKLGGSGDVVINTSFMAYGTESTPYVLGCLSSTSSNTIGLGVSCQSDYTTIIVFPGTVVSISPDPVKGVKHDITATVTSSGASITDGTLSASDTFTPRVHNVANLYLFGIKKATANEVNYPFTGRIYYVKVTEGGVDKLELIPCVRLSDGMAGFWDTVNESFIYDSLLVAAPSAHNTSAEIEFPAQYSYWNSGNRSMITGAYLGTTKNYTLSATTSLYPAGILPSKMVASSADNPTAGLYFANIDIFDDYGNVINHVNVKPNASTWRWAQQYSATWAEYMQEWTVSEYSKIAFPVDLRYIHDSYMYHVPTGQIFFAGRNTPYYGMHNISEAST